MGDVQAVADRKFSSFLLNPEDSRVNRFIKVRIVRLFRSTWDVQIEKGLSCRISPFR